MLLSQQFLVQYQIKCSGLLERIERIIGAIGIGIEPEHIKLTIGEQINEIRGIG